MSLDKTKTKTTAPLKGLSCEDKLKVEGMISELENILVYTCISTSIDVQFDLLKAISLLKEVKGV